MSFLLRRWSATWNELCLFWSYIVCFFFSCHSAWYEGGTQIDMKIRGEGGKERKKEQREEGKEK